jgi:hypothetical protein
MNNAVALGLRMRSDTQKEPIAAIIGINMMMMMMPSSFWVVVCHLLSSSTWILHINL